MKAAISSTIKLKYKRGCFVAALFYYIILIILYNIGTLIVSTLAAGDLPKGILSVLH